MFITLWLALASPLPAATPAPERSTATISVVWPPEGHSMPLSDGEFILGSVTPPSAPFSINGATVPLYHNGAFLAWLPIAPGTFTFHCSAGLQPQATTLTRSIFVVGPPAPLPVDPPAIDQDSLWPNQDSELRPGDWLTFKMRASPGRQARCRLGSRPWAELRETRPGFYEALQAVNAGENAAPAPVKCRLKSGPKATSRAKASIFSSPPAVAVIKNHAVVRTAAGGYMAFPLPGTKLPLAGRVGDELKVLLAASLEGFLDAKDADILPPGTPLPMAVAGTIHTTALPNSTKVRISLSEKTAFTVEEGDDPSSLTVRLFNCSARGQWIIYDSNDRFVQEARWKQESSDVVAITIRLNDRMTLWGWQASYEKGSLCLELSRAPTLAAAPASPLKGLTVVVDPGHMPSAPGEIGPMGTREMDANLAIAEAFAKVLSERGAVPVLTRTAADQEVSLTERPRIAVERKGDLFVSIHNNAFSDGKNPFAQSWGFSVFYYHPHSLALARHVYRSYEKRIPLPGEGLRYGNFLVARLSAMPAILVENAYITIPDQEEKLNDPAFRGILARALADGLSAFLEEERSKQPTVQPESPKKSRSHKSPPTKKRHPAKP